MRKLIMMAALACVLASCGEDSKVGVVAHRGYWNCEQAGFTENSIASLKAAQENGFWGSEFDVQLTLDDVPVVNHNNDIQGYKIKNYPLDTLKTLVLGNGEHISTLDEYLAQGEKSSGTVLVLEFKDQRDTTRNDILIDKSLELLKAHGLYDPSRVIFISFSMYVCGRIARECPEFTNQFLGGKISPSELKAMGINGMDYSYGDLNNDPGFIGEALDLGMSVNVWTVNDDSTMVDFIGRGVQFITTNEPLTTRKVLGDKELRL